MTKQTWWERLGAPDDRAAMGAEYGRGSQSTPSLYEGLGAAGRYGDDLLRSLNGRNPDLLDAAEEVAAEQRVQIVLVSREAHLPPALLSWLRQAPVTPTAGRSVQQGIWQLVSLQTTAPACGAPDQIDAAFGDAPETFADAAGEDTDDPAGEVLSRLSGDADILLYLVAHRAGWGAEDTAWVARLRTLGAPILPVVVTMPDAPPRATGDAPPPDELTARVQRQAGVKPSWIHLQETTGDGDGNDAHGAERQPPADSAALVQRIVALRPRVAVALAQDIAWCRPLLARRIIRTGALFTALLSAQPVPLLDLPFQVVLQWKVALQLAAIYGRPGLDYRSREMVGTIVWNLLIRFVMQQAVRLAPVVGGLLSALIGGVSTALLGHALITLYENEDRWNLAQQRQQALARAAAAVTPVRIASAHAADAIRTQQAALSQRVGGVVRAVWPHHPPQAGAQQADNTPTAVAATASGSATVDTDAAAVDTDAAAVDIAPAPPTLPVVNLTPPTRGAR